ncbi:hypothetical protein QP519_10410 [Weeksella virosa]|uniref:Uncharacterized protein n=1 Tax=Weeksella virosa (strain ATCC 43766 / DSM 16922 / JCM 21250 / CCUG 30538 / CDC 9751 / IAM 14551 / NBRC 16016 / NCTC 11634 / CL345/78) TaxID=865938 RepID=F0NXQ3_WEEVC|nr:hypothetical protein [Weeksella virosa]ADX66960.1 hypothetical protein Weevi_0238 [Weeksella virosa DSM 16922]MDK7375946.1 hypothetical protein [Weeksella virosa]VEH63311.1 Uncharacterised protein [Weeksella virosa]
MKCCDKIEFLGCFSACEPINTGLIADSSGVWRIEIDYMGITKYVSIDLKENQQIIINEKLNEDYLHTIRIINPKKQLLQNKCFSFKTIKTLCLN